jgi:hypothetical protein
VSYARTRSPATLVVQRHSRQCGSLQNRHISTVLVGNRQKGIRQWKAGFLYIFRIMAKVGGDFRPALGHANIATTSGYLHARPTHRAACTWIRECFFDEEPGWANTAGAD